MRERRFAEELKINLIVRIDRIKMDKYYLYHCERCGENAPVKRVYFKVPGVITKNIAIRETFVFKRLCKNCRSKNGKNTTD